MECRDAPAERPRPAPGQALSRSLVALDQNSTIIAVVELSQSSWLVAGMLPGIERQPRKKLEPSPERLLALLHRWRDEAIGAGKEKRGCLHLHCRLPKKWSEGTCRHFSDSSSLYEPDPGSIDLDKAVPGKFAVD